MEHLIDRGVDGVVLLGVDDDGIVLCRPNLLREQRGRLALQDRSAEITIDRSTRSASFANSRFMRPNSGQFQARQDDLDAQQAAMGRGQDPLELRSRRATAENFLRRLRRDVAPLVEHRVDRRDSDAGQFGDIF